MANIEEVLQRGESLSGKYSNKVQLTCTKHKGQITKNTEINTYFAVTSAFVKHFVQCISEVLIVLQSILIIYKCPCYPCKSFPIFLSLTSVLLHNSM